MTFATRTSGGFLQRVLTSVAGFSGFASDKYASDLTQLFNAKSFDQLVRAARPIRLTINETSRLMEHTVESGATITDHRIIAPVEIRADFLLSRDEYRATYSAIKNLFLQGTLIGVQTRTTTFTNMIVKELPHEEEPDMFDVVPMSVSLLEIKFAEPQASAIPASKTKSPEYSDTMNGGKKNPITLSES